MQIIACVFFFKQNTAYEMRMSDWSSDVCSSDLLEAFGEHIDERGVDIVDALAVTAQLVVHRAGGSSCSRHAWHRDGGTGKPKVVAKIGQRGQGSARHDCRNPSASRGSPGRARPEIGRAPCRGRVWWSV